MGLGLTNKQYYEEIADAIRHKGGTSAELKPEEMAEAIEAIAVKGAVEPKTITTNGIYNPPADIDGYAPVTVNVPNTYTDADNGKVVSNKTLVAQTSKNINTNGTHSTVTNNQVIVNVPNSYGPGDEGKVVHNSALVAQTSTTKTANGTYDTTLNNQVIVAIPSADEEQF